jgi:hypothetical protein
MPINVVARETKFFNEFKNDVGFSANLSDFTLNLTGLTMENVKMTTYVEVNWNAAVSANDPWSADTVTGKVSKTVGTWQSDGFTIGDICDWGQNGIVVANLTIDTITPDGLTFYYTLNSGAITDTNNAGLIGMTPLTASVFKFGILGNTEPFNIKSKVSGNDQGYYGTDIGFDTGGGVRDTNFVTMIRLGTPQDWQTGTMKVRFVDNPATDVQRFEIEHEFTIPPWYLDGQLTNLENNLLPTLFTGTNTLKYAFAPGFRIAYTLPDSEKLAVIDNNSGSVGWFNEAFNGFQNDYEITNVAYEEQATTNVAQGILIGSKTRITIDVQDNAGNFSAGERAGVYVSYLPQQSEYQNTNLTQLKDNFLYDNAINNGGIGPVAGQDFITDFEITNIVGNTMTLTFDVDYSAAQKLRLAGLNAQSPIYYVIGVQLGDVTLASANSNRVILIGDVKVYDESADIPDLWAFPKMDIYTHERQIGVDAGSTDATDWIEDGLAIDYRMTLNLNKDAVLNSMNFMVVAFDPITQIYFELDRYVFNIFPAVISAGVQQLITNTTRGYILEAGDQFNEVSLSVGFLGLGIQQYNGIIGQKISWQDWLANQGVDTVFFDATEPNNNLNHKASNYSLLNGYEIRIAFFGNVFGTNTLGVSGLTDYLVLSPTLTTYNYEEDGGANVWSHVIETFDATGTTNLGGATLTGQDTLLRATWTHSGGPVTSLVGLWGINRIEETNQAGYAITECSSIYDTPLGQLLKPSTGLKLFMYLSGGLVVMECFIDGSIAQPNINYNLSTRIQDDNVVIGGKEKAESTDNKEKGESTDIKLIAP